MDAAAGVEKKVQNGYTAPAAHGSSLFGYQIPPPKPLEYVYNPSDGSVLIDHKGMPITVDRMLATKPLRGELSTRPGPGSKKLTYISGEGVSRTLNDIFGFDGWNLDITSVQQVESQQKNQRFHVAYTAQVRLTHKRSGAYKEDCGAGDSIDKSLGTALAHALKSSITDAMKRAARHFGDKLGNSLYQGNFNFHTAPITLEDALDKYDIERANTKFGFPKDQIYRMNAQNNSSLVHGKLASKAPLTAATTMARPPTTISHVKQDKIQASVVNNKPLLSMNHHQQHQQQPLANLTNRTFSGIQIMGDPLITPSIQKRQMTTCHASTEHVNNQYLVAPTANQHHNASIPPAKVLSQHGCPSLSINTTTNCENYNPPPTCTEGLKNPMLFSYTETELYVPPHPSMNCNVPHSNNNNRPLSSRGRRFADSTNIEITVAQGTIAPAKRPLTNNNTRDLMYNPKKRPAHHSIIKNPYASSAVTRSA